MYIVVDGNTLAYRTWHTPPVNATLQGDGWEDTLPVFLLSFCTQLTNIVEKIDRFRPRFTKLIIVWDGKNSTALRRSLYPEYKLKRQKDREADTENALLPRELIDATRQALSEVCQRYGIYSETAEGDDLIALLCEVFQGEQVCIVTRDNDLYQCVTHNVRVYDPFTWELIGPEDVQKKYGVQPGKIPELKALMGDKSDNYPGIKGVGPKKALALVGCYSKTQYPEVANFLRIATVPFDMLDTDTVLQGLAGMDLDSPPNWERITDKYGFGDRATSRLGFVV